MTGVDLLLVLVVAIFVYFLVLDVIYAALAVIGWRAVSDYVRRRPARDYKTVVASRESPAVTVLVPGRNEAATIVSSVRALLRLHYPRLEVIVVDDGSTDDMLAVLEREFALEEINRVPRTALAARPVRRAFISAGEPRLSVLQKEGGGKADALNAGLRYVSTPLFCAIDADTILDPEALARLVWEFQADPDTIAGGGIVRVLNGSTVMQGYVTRVGAPKSMLATIQALEYLRAFLGGRIAWSRFGLLLIISGAFGLFRRDAVVAAGGYATDTVGEDAELILRLHRHSIESGEHKRIIFFPDPICWTQVPESLRALIGQRDRWQRGLIEMLVRHRAMLLRRRYGRVGTVAMPFFAVFEALGPLVEVLGYVVMLTALALGVISPLWFAVFVGVSIVVGFVMSCMTLLVEERAYRRYQSWRDLAKLIVAAVVENFGYRQLMALVRSYAWLSVVTRRGAWGRTVRVGVGEKSPRASARAARPTPR